MISGRLGWKWYLRIPFIIEMFLFPPAGQGGGGGGGGGGECEGGGIILGGDCFHLI